MCEADNIRVDGVQVDVSELSDVNDWLAESQRHTDMRQTALQRRSTQVQFLGASTLGESSEA